MTQLKLQLDKAVALFRRVCERDDMCDAVLLQLVDDPSGNTAAYVLRRAYDTYMEDTCLPMRELVDRARRGDLLQRFAFNVQLDTYITTGVLDRAYKRVLRRISQGELELNTHGQSLLETSEE